MNSPLNEHGFLVDRELSKQIRELSSQAVDLLNEYVDKISPKEYLLLSYVIANGISFDLHMASIAENTCKSLKGI